MSLTNLEIVRVMCRSNLNYTCTEFLVNIRISNDRYCSVCKWKFNFLSYKVCVSFIIRINS